MDGKANQGNSPPAASVCAPDAQTAPTQISTLAKRPDFLKAARARRQGAASMLVQARLRNDGEASGIRVGFTCSKKVGNAVARNRSKRRLRAAARIVLPELGHDGWDYVLIGARDKTAARPFELMLDDLRYALRKLHSNKNRKADRR